MRRLIIPFLILCISMQIKGQCYEETRKEAIDAFIAKKFNVAKELFFEANMNCPDKPTSNDLSFWIKKCTEGLSASHKQATISLADKLSLYEDIATSEWHEGLMAVSKKNDWKLFFQKEKPKDIDTYSVDFRLKYVPKVGFINTNGDLVIPCQYLHPDYWSTSVGTYRFFEGYASVMQWNPEKGEALWGYVNKYGQDAIPFIYTGAGNFVDGASLVCINDDWSEWILINKKGDRLTNDTYHNQSVYFGDGLMAVQLSQNGLWGFINREYHYAIEPQFQDAGYFSNGLCCIKPQGSDLYGYINTYGKMVISPLYSKAYAFNEGKAVVFNKKEHGFNSAIIDTKGQIIDNYTLRPEYLGGPFYEELQECLVENYNKGLYSNALLCGKEYEKRANRLESNVSTSVDYWFAYLIGCIYYYGGDGIEQDYSKAIEYWKKWEYHKSFYMLGVCYNDACGVDVDYATALDYYKRCLNKDEKNKYAYYRIGLLYLNGQGVEKNFQIALSNFQRAKELGFIEAVAKIEECKNELRKLIQ